MDSGTYRLGVAGTAARIRGGETSPVDVVESLLQRIEQIDPNVHAWVTVDGEGARKRARRAEEDVEAGRDLGLLHGVPIGVKDLYFTADLPTTAGSPILADFVPGEDAEVVKNLRSAGAIVLGKTVTTEWAASDAPPTRNPWNLQHTPGGSSSGSGAAVASGMCPAATGTQAAGSVIRPASFNGIVGLKPTHGLLSRRGLISHSWTVDHPGILVRSVEDAAMMLEAMVGGGAPGGDADAQPPRYMDGVKQPAGRPRIGFLRDYYMSAASDGLRAHVESVVEKLGSAGAEIVEVPFPGDPDLVLAAHWTLMKVEFAAAQEQLFAEHAGQFSPHVRGLIEVGQLIPGSSYVQALRVRTLFRRTADEAVSQVDALLAPSAESAPLLSGGDDSRPKAVPQTGDHSFQMPWSFCGLPAISLPSGLDEGGMPLGVQLIGARQGEAKLLEVAAWCERVLDFASVREGIVGQSESAMIV